MAKSTQANPGWRSGEVLSATIDLASLDTIARPHEATAYVLLELHESLLSEVRLWIEDVQFEFAVVDPVYGTVEPTGESVTEHGWPFPLVRAVLDRVGVGLLDAADPR